MWYARILPDPVLIYLYRRVGLGIADAESYFDTIKDFDDKLDDLESLEKECSRRGFRTLSLEELNNSMPESFISLEKRTRGEEPTLYVPVYKECLEKNPHIKVLELSTDH